MKKTLIGPENPSTGLRQVVLTRLLVVPACRRQSRVGRWPMERKKGRPPEAHARR